MVKKEFTVLQAREVLAPYLPYKLKVDFELSDNHNCLSLVRYANKEYSHLNGEIFDCICGFKSLNPHLKPLKHLYKHEHKVWLNLMGYLVDNIAIDMLIFNIKEGRVQHRVMQELIKQKFDVFGIGNGFKIVS